MNVAASQATVGVRDLKNQLSSYLDRVKAGEHIVVTEHGRPIAQLVGVAPSIDRMAALVAAGVVRAPVASRKLPRHRVRLGEGGSIDAAVADERR